MCGKVVLLDLLADEADQSRPKASLSWFGGKVWYRRYCKFKLFPCFVQMDCVQRWKARNSILKQLWLVPLLQSRAQFWAATWWGRREATKTHLEVQQGAKIKIQWEGLQSVLLTHHSNGNLLCCLMFWIKSLIKFVPVTAGAMGLLWPPPLTTHPQSVPATPQCQDHCSGRIDSYEIYSLCYQGGAADFVHEEGAWETRGTFPTSTKTSASHLSKTQVEDIPRAGGWAVEGPAGQLPGRGEGGHWDTSQLSCLWLRQGGELLWLGRTIPFTRFVCGDGWLG